MKMTSLFGSIAVLLALGAPLAHADDITYACDGTYDSKVAFDPYTPSSVSLKVHLDVTMLGDSSASGEYTLTQGKLSMKATNDDMADAGSIRIKKAITGKVDRAINPKFKGYIKFNLGSKVSPAYPTNGDEPETVLLIPTDNSDIAYVQRQASGHDSYPTLELHCGD